MYEPVIDRAKRELGVRNYDGIVPEVRRLKEENRQLRGLLADELPALKRSVRRAATFMQLVEQAEN